MERRRERKRRQEDRRGTEISHTFFYYRLGFTNSEDVVEVKGRVACEITAGDELVLTELIFLGIFNELDVDQSVSLLSCFVFDETV